MNKIEVEKRIHRVWKELDQAQQKGVSIRQLMGKYQYIHSSEKGVISLVRFLNYFKEGDNFWEIYCLKGELFEDTERFEWNSQAQKRIRELLK